MTAAKTLSSRLRGAGFSNADAYAKAMIDGYMESSEHASGFQTVQNRPYITHDKPPEMIDQLYWKRKMPALFAPPNPDADLWSEESTARFAGVLRAKMAIRRKKKTGEAEPLIKLIVEQQSRRSTSLLFDEDSACTRFPQDQMAYDLHLVVDFLIALKETGAVPADKALETAHTLGRISGTARAAFRHVLTAFDFDSFNRTEEARDDSDRSDASRITIGLLYAAFVLFLLLEFVFALDISTMYFNLMFFPFGIPLSSCLFFYGVVRMIQCFFHSTASGRKLRLIFEETANCTHAALRVSDPDLYSCAGCYRMPGSAPVPANA